MFDDNPDKDNPFGFSGAVAFGESSLPVPTSNSISKHVGIKFADMKPRRGSRTMLERWKC